MKPTPIQERQATAIHEAAHAIITALFGFQLQEVTIEATADFSGCTFSSPPSRNDHPAAFEQIERRIISLFAGAIAVQRIFPTFPRRLLGDSTDKEAIDYFLKYVCYFTDETRRQALKRLRAVSTAWVNYPTIQQLIRGFANELLAHKTLSGNQATRLFKKLLRSELSSATTKPLLNWDLFDLKGV